MSELINNGNKNLDLLIAYAKGILSGERGSELYAEYRESLIQVKPKDVITVVDELVKTGADGQNVKMAVNKILNIFYEPIKKHGKALPDKNSFLFYLMAENREMEKRMLELKIETKRVFGQKNPGVELIQRKDIIGSKLSELKEYDNHYLKKENILFPHFEKVFPDYRCVSVMWSMHDDARSSLDRLIDNLLLDEPSINEFNFEIGRLYFSVLPVIFREDYILFPECLKVITSDTWQSMLEQSLEIGFSFIEPHLEVNNIEKVNKAVISGSAIDLDTGHLTTEQIINLFNHLPVDITFVDENDEVRYFSNPKNRHFIRSKAIIGRKVQNCHPPESIEIVNSIVESFKTGAKDSESFWIQMKGKFILIQYFAIRDKEGNYKGTVEVSQDITEIKLLEGEKRLLDV